jgi:hypothetical protein
MLIRNTREHLRGERPRLESLGASNDASPKETGPTAGALVAGATATAAEQRIGISAADQSRLLHALDFWWLYAAYAGLPGAPLAAVAALLAAFGIACAIRAAASARRET